MKPQTLTRTELIKNVADKTNQSQHVVKDTLDALFGEIQTALAKGDRVEFRGFGVWEVYMSKERVGRNPGDPNSGPIRIPSKKSIRFRLGGDLRAALLAPPTPVVTAQPVITAQPVTHDEYACEHGQPKP